MILMILLEQNLLFYTSRKQTKFYLRLNSCELEEKQSDFLFKLFLLLSEVEVTFHDGIQWESSFKIFFEYKSWLSKHVGSWNFFKKCASSSLSLPPTLSITTM